MCGMAYINQSALGIWGSFCSHIHHSKLEVCKSVPIELLLICLTVNAPV